MLLLQFLDIVLHQHGVSVQHGLVKFRSPASMPTWTGTRTLSPITCAKRSITGCSGGKEDERPAALENSGPSSLKFLGVVLFSNGAIHRRSFSRFSQLFPPIPRNGKMTADSKTPGLATRMSNSPSVHEAPAEPARPSGIPKYWVVLGLLVLAHAVFGAFFNPNTDRIRVSEIGFYLTTGATLSRPILFAVWAAFASQRFYHRFLWSLLSCAFVATIQELADIEYGPESHGSSVVLSYMFFCCVTTLVLSCVRHFYPWQIAQHPQTAPCPTRKKYQFTIRHLLVATTLIAIVCGLLRTIHVADPNRFWLPLICQVLALVFPAIVFPWVILADRKTIHFLILAILLGGLPDVARYLLLIENGPLSPTSHWYRNLVQPIILSKSVQVHRQSSAPWFYGSAVSG